MKIKGYAFLAIALVAFAAPALGFEPYKGKHVRVEFKGRKAVGEVTAEDEDSVTVSFSPTSKKGYTRAEVRIEDLEPLWQDAHKKCDEAKTADERLKVAKDLVEAGFTPEECKFAIDAALKLDPDHAATHEFLGEVAKKKPSGETIWIPKSQSKKYDDRIKALSKTEDEMKDRPWDGVDADGKPFKIIVRKPEKRPEYEIVTNCPRDTAEQYANFMVDLKKGLTDLIQNQVKVQIKWIKNDCKTCNGTGKATGGTGKDVPPCPRCGGSGEEPCKIFLTNSHKLFIDVVGKGPHIGGFFVPGYYEQGECERPIVAFHGTFGTGDNTYGVLAHEGTHQLQACMWKGFLFFRPGWMTEGLAVFFGDGLDMDKVKAGHFAVTIPQDRLSGLRRDIGTPGLERYKLKDVVGFDISWFQQDPGLYAYGWSIIYFMLNTKEEFEFKGKKIDLAKAYAKYFQDNCEKGSLEAYPAKPALGLTNAMGIDPKDCDEALDALEPKWRKFILDLPLKQSVEVDQKDPKHIFSKELKFEFNLPSGKGKTPHEWTLVKAEDLVRVLGEVCGLTAGNGAARIFFCQDGNTEGYDTDDAFDAALSMMRWSRIDGKLKACSKCGGKELPKGETCKNCDGIGEEPPERGVLPGTATATLSVDFEGKETFHPIYFPKPRKDSKNEFIRQKGRMLVTRTAATIYKVLISCDADKWAEYEPELREMLDSFTLTE